MCKFEVHILQHLFNLDFSLNPMSLECATIFAAAFVRCKEKPQTLIINSCGFKGESAEKVKCANLFALALYCLASIDKLPLKMFVLVDRLAVYLVVSCDRHSWALAMLGAQPRPL